jgi:hypothetical protein
VALPNIADGSFEPALGSLLERCSELPDLSTRAGEERNREKTQLLAELLSFFSLCVEIKRLNPKLQRGIFLMLSTNLFRPFRLPTQIETADFTISVAEPTALYLGYCYRLIVRFLELFPGAEFVNFAFLNRVMDLSQSPDARERIAVASVLNMFYTCRPDDRLRFIAALRNRMIAVTERQLLVWAAGPLLSCARHIFLTSAHDAADGCRDLLMGGIVPLLGMQFVGIVYADLKSAITGAIAELPDCRMRVLVAIQRLWPLSGFSRTTFVVDLLLTVVNDMNSTQFRPIAETFFAFIAEHIASPNIAFSSTILDFLLRDDAKQFCKANLPILFEKCIDALVETAEGSWSADVRAKAKVMLDKLAAVSHRDPTRGRRILAAKGRQLAEKAKTWVKIFAQVNWAAMGQTKDEKIVEAQRVYAAPVDPSFCKTHFLPPPDFRRVG